MPFTQNIHRPQQPFCDQVEREKALNELSSWLSLFLRQLLVWLVFTANLIQIESPEKREPQLKNHLIRPVCVSVCRVLSSLLFDRAGAGPLWAVLSLGSGLGLCKKAS